MSALTTADVLRAAKALIDTPEKWTQGVFARDANGGEVHPASPDAVSRCADGAIVAATWYSGGRTEACEAISVALEFGTEMPNPRTVAWHDAPERTHSDVMSVFDRAIVAAGSK